MCCLPETEDFPAGSMTSPFPGQELSVRSMKGGHRICTLEFIIFQK